MTLHCEEQVNLDELRSVIYFQDANELSVGIKDLVTSSRVLGGTLNGLECFSRNYCLPSPIFEISALYYSTVWVDAFSLFGYDSSIKLLISTVSLTSVGKCTRAENNSFVALPFSGRCRQKLSAKSVKQRWLEMKWNEMKWKLTFKDIEFLFW